MTINTAIALVNTGIAVSLLVLGAVCLWQARQWLRRWPATALVALGGAFAGCGVLAAQLVLFRANLDPWPFDENAPGTLILRLVVLVIVGALVRRVLRGNLLTPSDRDRLRDGGRT